MGIERQNESDKIHGDKLESALDRQAAPGRKQGQSDPDDEAEELDLEDREESEAEDQEDE